MSLLQEKKQLLAKFTTAYNALNTAQKEAVDTIEGPVMVIAGPGTGKTQILTLRIANILKETQSNPENVLALTFTNSGVRAMRERLKTYIGDDAYRVGIYTFHSFAEHILKKFSSYFPSREFASVITELEKTKIIEHILLQHDFQKIVSAYDRFSSLTQIVGAVNDIKQEGYTPAEFLELIPAWEKTQMESETMFYKRATGKFKVGDIKPTEKTKVEDRVAKVHELATVFSAYQQELTKRNLYDFSDMILTVLGELEKNENLKYDLQEQFQYVLVDEHQDTNDGQNKLIEFLTDAEHLNGAPNLFVVGDEKQSIYRFQGASDQTFSYFKNHYRDVKVVKLEQNYRSTTQVLDGAHNLIVHSLPDATELHGNLAVDYPVSVKEFSDYKFELLFLVRDIEMKLKAGVPADEIAIIYRSNKHLLEIKNLFQQFNIPYTVLSRDTLLDDPAIIMLVTCIKVIANPYDNESLARLLFADFLGLDSLMAANTLQSYRLISRDKNNSQALIDYIKTDEEYQAVIEMITHLHTYAANHLFSETFKEVLHRSGFLTWVLQKTDSRSALRKVEVLFNQVRQLAELSPMYGINDFVEFVMASLKYNLKIEVAATTVGKGVQCMTAHSSKGLEFESVYLMNTTRSNWEKSRGFSGITLPLNRYAGELDDERRLFYVAVTRAKKHLVITSSSQDWGGKSQEPSQFISELGVDSSEASLTESFEIENEAELVRFFSNESLKDSVFTVDYLVSRFKEENLSVTALNNYIDCPIKYLFRNLIQLPDVYTPSLRYGNTIHQALENFFIESKQAKSILPRERLLNEYQAAIDVSGFYDAEYERFLLKGKQALGMYYDYYHHNWSVKIDIEEYIRSSIEVHGTSLTLSGKIDKIEYLDEEGVGSVRVIDYKTGKPFSKKSSKSQKQGLERQIRFYHLLLQGYKNGAITIHEAVLDFVEPIDGKEFEQKTLQVTEADIIELKGEISTMTAEILSGEFLTKGCGKKDCEACRFWEVLHAKNKQ
ncbi:ATP-dependent helicase [Patescibacteria group bacterium]|nr:ATP-dependent helicase [Patescibacteria group bacterium]